VALGAKGRRSIGSSNPQNDLLTPAEITAATGEHLQEFLEAVLCQIKRLLHGNEPGEWTDDPTDVDGQDVSLRSIARSASGPALAYVTRAWDESISESVGTAEKVKVTTAPVELAAGDYLVTVSYGWRHSHAGTDFIATLYQDAGAGFEAVGQPHRQEPQDPLADQRQYPCRRIWRVLEAGTYQWELRYRSQATNRRASIWEALIMVERLSE
jgi:hypothetical protein